MHWIFFLQTFCRCARSKQHHNKTQNTSNLSHNRSINFATTFVKHAIISIQSRGEHKCSPSWSCASGSEAVGAERRPRVSKQRKVGLRPKCAPYLTLSLREERCNLSQCRPKLHRSHLCTKGQQLHGRCLQTLAI